MDKISKQNHLNNIVQIIGKDYGFNNSIDAGIPLDAQFEPLPLYTYPAIEYLKSLNFKGKKVFEFGSGNSTLYWLRQGSLVFSIEHNPEWIDKISLEINHLRSDFATKNYLVEHQYIFANNLENYANSICKFDNNYFDLIVIDGAFNRYLCAKNAINKIKENGLIILDNSDWYPNTAQFLRENLDFIQIDFYGFRPSKPDAAVTSLFFSRKFKIECKSTKQPNFAIGGKQKNSNLDFL